MDPSKSDDLYITQWSFLCQSFPHPNHIVVSHLFSIALYFCDMVVPITNKPNLAIHSCHSYPMWDFTCMYIPNNLPLTCEFLPFCGI